MITETLSWPEIFTNPTLIESRTKNQLLGDGLVAWGHCMSGLAGKPPDTFGEVMAKLGEKLSIVPIPENFLKLEI